MNLNVDLGSAIEAIYFELRAMRRVPVVCPGPTFDGEEFVSDKPCTDASCSLCNGRGHTTVGALVLHQAEAISAMAGEGDEDDE